MSISWHCRNGMFTYYFYLRVSTETLEGSCSWEEALQREGSIEDGRSRNSCLLFKCCVALDKSPNLSEVQVSHQKQRAFKTSSVASYYEMWGGLVNTYCFSLRTTLRGWEWLLFSFYCCRSKKVSWGQFLTTGGAEMRVPCLAPSPGSFAGCWDDSL